MNPNFKYSSKSWDKEPELKEGENEFFEGMFSTPALLGTALAWLILATIFLYINREWAFIMAITMVLIAGGLVLFGS